jgi:hypothetical protein
MTIGAIELEPILYIARNMRDRDFREIMATNDDESPEAFAIRVFSGRTTGLGFIGYTADGIPAGAFGSYRMWGDVYSMWMFGTKRWPEVRLGMTRFAVKHAIPAMFNEFGMKIGQCLSLSDYPEIHKWLRLLGAQEDCKLTKWGKNRESFTRFIWSTSL